MSSAHIDHDQQRLPHSALIRAAGYGAALIVTWGALTLPVNDSTLSASAALFGFQRVLVAHLLASMPLSVFAARFMIDRSAPRRPLGTAIACSLVGLAAAVCVSFFIPTIAAVTHNDVGFAGRVLSRAGLCLLLELPWCAASEMLACAAAGNKSSAAGSRRIWEYIGAGLIATALPAVYTCDVGRREAARATQMIERQQIAYAKPIAAALVAAGCPASISGMPPRQAARELSDTIAAIEERLQATDKTKNNPQELIERAAMMAALGRTSEAAALVEAPAADRPDAALLLAAILQEQQQWDASSHWYATAAKQLRSAPATPQTAAGLVRAINGRAFNAREQGNYTAAADLYQQGITELPEAAAYFHFQLGRHHKLGGRPTTAAEHLSEAARLEPQKYEEQAAQLLRQMSFDSPGCLLRTPLPQTGQVAP